MATKSRPGDGTHRSVLLAVGLLLVAGSVAGLLTGSGFFGSRTQGMPVFANLVGRFMGRQGEWAWPVAVVPVLLVGLLALRWLLTLTRSDRAGTLDLPAQRKSGRTLVDGAAVLAPFTAEIEAYHGVTNASARWHGQPRDAQLFVTVTHRPDVDLPALLARVEDDALAHLRTALGRDDLPVQLDLKASRARGH